MKWIKEREPWRAELIHDCDLECNGKFLVSASKENPVIGTVTNYGYKKIGRNVEGKGNMERLTSNKSVSEMGMVELAYNSCFVKDRAVWYRDYGVEVDARILARKLLKDFADGDDAFTCDEDFEEYITACLEDGTDSIEGLIALFYRNLWAMAGLREHLKYYEDLEEQGKLLKLPVAVGETVYTLNPLPGGKTVIGETTADAFMCALGMLEGRFGKTIFLSLQEAEEALKEMRE